MQECDVSVIIPTYNRLSFLEKALASVLIQSAPAREIIIVDDGSEDGTTSWLQKQNIPQLKLISQENQGPAQARNRGAAIAGSRYLAFLDSDDAWLETKLERQVQFMTENPAIKLCQTEEIWIRKGRRVNPMRKHAKPSGDVFEACLKLCLISPSAVMIERDFFAELGGFDPDFEVCEDYELWLRASLKTKIVTLADALTIKQGGHADQLSRKHWGMDRFRVAAMEKLLLQQDLSENQREAVKNELAEKLKILSIGFAKRHPLDVNPYEKNVKIKIK